MVLAKVDKASMFNSIESRSPFLGKNCRFDPNCSSYAIIAFESHGILKGVILTIKRISRCHPWGKSGYDPVKD